MLASCAIVVIEFFAGVVFTVCTWVNRYREAGILEWTISFMGIIRDIPLYGTLLCKSFVIVICGHR